MAPASDTIRRLRFGSHSMAAWAVVPFADCMSVDAVPVVVAVSVGDAAVVAAA